MVRRLHVCYVIYRKNQFLILVRVRSIPVGSLNFFIDDNCYSKFFSQVMNIVLLLHLFSMSFFIPNHKMSCFSLASSLSPGVRNAVHLHLFFQLCWKLNLVTGKQQTELFFDSAKFERILREFFLSICF